MYLVTSIAYGLDTDKNVAISGMQKLECHENVEISLVCPKEDDGAQGHLPSKTKMSMKERLNSNFTTLTLKQHTTTSQN